jgi:hypothetical protein
VRAAKARAARYSGRTLDLDARARSGVGDILSVEPGATVGPIGQGVNDRVTAGIASDPRGTWSSHTLSDARVAVVPVVNWSGCKGNCSR